MLVGAQVAGRIEAFSTPAESKAAAELVLAKSAEITKLTESINSATAEQKPELEASLKSLEAEKAAARKAELKAIHWKMLWGAPAAFAGVILLLFVALFRPTKRPLPEGGNSSSGATA